jgi:hypothetical protein
MRTLGSLRRRGQSIALSTSLALSANLSTSLWLWTMGKTSRYRPPERIASALQPILDRLDGEGHFGIVRLMKTWPEVVGETIARRTEVQSLKFHTAVVKVSGAMWIQELNLMKTQILSRLREALHDDSVRDIRFVKGTLSRRERPKLRAVPRATRHHVELPELKDPELRRAFEDLIEAWGRASR